MTAPTRAPVRRRGAADPVKRPSTPAPAPRPHLRVVPPNTLSRRGRQRRARRFGVLLGVMVFIAVFGVVAAHVLLTQRQFRLERLENQAAAQEAKYEQLRLQVAQLESPDRVVDAARALGMVPPASVTYLTSSGTDPASVSAQHSPSDEWARVKSHLAAAKP